jgi:DNA-binding GntR family transcriptional regulator
MAVFERLVSSTLRGRVTEKIREAILGGILKQGERIVERQLASEFATSLTVVREALIQLEAEGFVTKKPNSTTHVTEFSRDAAQKIFSVRRVLEGFAVEEAARLVSPEECDHIDKLYLELLDSASLNDEELFVRFIRRDMAFHQAIWKITRNEYLESTLRRIVLPIFAFTAMRLVSRCPFDLAKDASSHLPFLEAIKNREPEAAHVYFLAALDEWLSKTLRYVFPADEMKTEPTALLETQIKV